jgi:hypothetical protein
MDLALGRGEGTVFSGIRKIRDWSRHTHQNELTKLLKLIDSLLEHIRNTLDGRKAGAAREARYGIWGEQLGATGGCDSSGGLEPFPIKCISRQ